MNETQNESAMELNRRAAEAMGWPIHDERFENDDDIADIPETYPFVSLTYSSLSLVHENWLLVSWNPCGDLNQAHELTTKLGYGGYVNADGEVGLLDKNGLGVLPFFPHDGTASSVANALTQAVLAGEARKGGEAG